MRLQSFVSAVSDARLAHQIASATVFDLAPQVADARNHAEATLRTAQDAIRLEKNRTAILTDYSEKRAGLLGGEPTETHRTRINELRLEAKSVNEAAIRALQETVAQLGAARGRRDAAFAALETSEAVGEDAAKILSQELENSGISLETLSGIFELLRDQVDLLRNRLRALEDAVTSAMSATAARRNDIAAAEAAGIPDSTTEALTEMLAMLDREQNDRQERFGAIASLLQSDAATRATLAGLEAEIAGKMQELDVWQAVNTAIGSRNGDKFARAAQSITLDVLVERANHHLADLKPRYRLKRAADLALQIEDRDMGGEIRATRSLSGGERFLVSLALALALSRLGSKGGLAATLFIDEGFGSLDAESLDLAIDALETLQSQGRSVGVISHVEAMKDRIPVQIRVVRQGTGKSSVNISGPV